MEKHVKMGKMQDYMSRTAQAPLFRGIFRAHNFQLKVTREKQSFIPWFWRMGGMYSALFFLMTCVYSVFGRNMMMQELIGKVFLVKKNEDSEVDGGNDKL